LWVLNDAGREELGGGRMKITSELNSATQGKGEILLYWGGVRAWTRKKA